MAINRKPTPTNADILFGRLAEQKSYREAIAVFYRTDISVSSGLLSASVRACPVAPADGTGVRLRLNK